MGSVSMTLPWGLCVFAILVSPAFSQETQRGSKARFDRILQQFGFNQERRGGWQETKGRRNFVAEIAGPKLSVPRALTGPKLDVPRTLTGPKLDIPQTLTGPKLDVPRTLTGPKLSVSQSFPSPKLGVPQTLAGPKLDVPQTASGQDLLKRLQDEAIDKTRPASEKGTNPDQIKVPTHQVKRPAKEDALAKLFSVAKDETHR